MCNIPCSCGNWRRWIRPLVVVLYILLLLVVLPLCIWELQKSAVSLQLSVAVMCMLFPLLSVSPVGSTDKHINTLTVSLLVMAGQHTQQSMVHCWDIRLHDHTHIIMGHSSASGSLHSARAPETYHQVNMSTSTSAMIRNRHSLLFNARRFHVFYRILWMVPIYSLDSVSCIFYTQIQSPIILAET